ncbi:hypothetical protein D3C76_1363760 [compost metagenome]
MLQRQADYGSYARQDAQMISNLPVMPITETEQQHQDIMAFMVHLRIHVTAGLPFSSIYLAWLQFYSAALR